MKNNPVHILNRVLTIIEYKDDKNAFIQEFLNLCLNQALIEMLKELPKERQLSLNQELKNQKDKEKISRIVKSYFPDGQYEKILSQATQKLFTDYIETVMPTLSVNQKNSLLLYLSSVGS